MLKSLDFPRFLQLLLNRREKDLYLYCESHLLINAGVEMQILQCDNCYFESHVLRDSSGQE